MSTRPHPESVRIIREARHAAGLTQKELAEKLDVTTGRYKKCPASGLDAKEA